MFWMTENIKNTSLSDDLFTKDKIKEWYVRWDKNTWFWNINHYRWSIEYSNGDLSWKKRFEAQTVEELFQMMDTFIKNNK